MARWYRIVCLSGCAAEVKITPNHARADLQKDDTKRHHDICCVRETIRCTRRRLLNWTVIKLSPVFARRWLFITDLEEAGGIYYDLCISCANQFEKRSALAREYSAPSQTYWAVVGNKTIAAFHGSSPASALRGCLVRCLPGTRTRAELENRRSSQPARTLRKRHLPLRQSAPHQYIDTLNDKPLPKTERAVKRRRNLRKADASQTAQIVAASAVLTTSLTDRR